MATAQPDLVVCVVDSTNHVIEDGGVAGSAVRQPDMVVRVVDSSLNLLEDGGTAGATSGGVPSHTMVVVDSSNNVFGSDGTVGAEVRRPSMTVCVVDASNSVFDGKTVSAVVRQPQATVRLVDASNVILDTLFGGAAVSGTAPTVRSSTSTANVSVAGITLSALADATDNDVVVVIVGITNTNGGGAVTCTGVSDSVGSYTPLVARAYHAPDAGTPFLNCSIWWREVTATATTGNITATFSGTTDETTSIGLLVQGCGNPASPWDANGSLPAGADGATGSSAPTISGVSTTSLGTLFVQGLIGARSDAANSDQTSGSGWTVIANPANQAGNNYTKGSAQYQGFTTAQSGISPAFNVAWTNWTTVGHALVGT